ncbi:MAG: radical SAM-associated putative lipoprotein [Treponema sp.]|nr:radical SAM-associated putative lipoprotein [Treponema sp.]
MRKEEKMMRDKINWTWKRIVGTVLGILGIGTLTSCYGVYEENEFDVYGTVKGNINGTEQAIKGIPVVLYRGSDAKDSKVTDSDGWYEFRDLTEGSYTLRFTDIDGEENGSFKQKDVAVTLNFDDRNENVTLENAE